VRLKVHSFYVTPSVAPSCVFRWNTTETPPYIKRMVESHSAWFFACCACVSGWRVPPVRHWNRVQPSTYQGFEQPKKLAGERQTQLALSMPAHLSRTSQPLLKPASFVAKLAAHSRTPASLESWYVFQSIPEKSNPSLPS